MYVLVMNIIGFFSKSEWIDLFSGILLLVTFKSQKNQFKEQNKSTEKQFKEQNEQSKNQLKTQIELADKQLKTQIELTDKKLKAQFETADNQLKEQSRIAEEQLKEQMEQQNKAAKEQLEAQHELALKKEKRMLATQIRLAKYEEFLLALTEYIDLHFKEYSIISRSYLYNNDKDHPKTKQFRSQLDELDSKLNIVYNKINVLSPFCSEFEEPWSSLYFSYAYLDQFIFDNFKKPEIALEEQSNIELSESELDDLITKDYHSYHNKLKGIYEDFYPKGRDLMKLVNDSIFKIISELDK